MIPAKKLERTDIDEFAQADMVNGVLNSICRLLPHAPNDFEIWSDGEEILCREEIVADAIADLFDALYAAQTVNTGYYDPAEDERNNEVTPSTGFYYVTVN